MYFQDSSYYVRCARFFALKRRKKNKRKANVKAEQEVAYCSAGGYIAPCWVIGVVASCLSFLQMMLFRI